MAGKTHFELVLWAALLIVQGLACAGIALGLYVSAQKPSLSIEATKGPMSAEHLTKLKNHEGSLNKAQLSNLVDYCVGLETMVNAHQRAAIDIVSQARKVSLLFIAVLVLSILLEVTLIISGRNRKRIAATPSTS